MTTGGNHVAASFVFRPVLANNHWFKDIAATEAVQPCPNKLVSSRLIPVETTVNTTT